MQRCEHCGALLASVEGHGDCRRRRALVAENWRDGREGKAGETHTAAGVLIFAGETVRSKYPPPFEAVELATLCWAYRRRTTHWSVGIWLPIPMPYRRRYEVVMHTRDGAGGTIWRRAVFGGSKSEVETGIVALMKRAPWALYGFTEATRLAMSPGRRAATTLDVEERRKYVEANGVRPDWPSEEEVRPALVTEQLRRFWGSSLD